MKVRAWQQLHDDLGEMASRYNVKSMSDISRRACRKFNNLDKSEQVEVFKINEPSTYKGPEMLFNIPENLLLNKTASDLRKILVWYIKDQRKKERIKTPLELDPYKGKIEIIRPESIK